MNDASKVFIDTNILINDFLYRYWQRTTGLNAHNALVSLKNKGKQMYIAIFSVMQVISTLERARVPKDEVAKEVKRLTERYELVQLAQTDIENALSHENLDLEDCMQYELSQKVKCFYILTDNVKDFRSFKNIVVVKAKKHKSIL
jgi:predicted nucleic acid-binding protein